MLLITTTLCERAHERLCGTLNKDTHAWHIPGQGPGSSNYQHLLEVTANSYLTNTNNSLATRYTAKASHRRTRPNPEPPPDEDLHANLEATELTHNLPLMQQSRSFSKRSKPFHKMLNLGHMVWISQSNQQLGVRIQKGVKQLTEKDHVLAEMLIKAQEDEFLGMRLQAMLAGQSPTTYRP
jgi:hypothetical protein